MSSRSTASRAARRTAADDWFYYVNGVQAGKGAADTKVHDGDHVWWDRHDWAATENIPAVVGSYPEPFVDGYGGKRYPVRVECTQPNTKACTNVYSALGAEQIVVGLGCLTAARSTTSRCASSSAPTRRSRSTGPPTCCATARRRAASSRASLTAVTKLELLDQTGRVVRTLGAGAGLIAATRLYGQPPVWFVTGTDAAGVAAAVQAFNAGRSMGTSRSRSQTTSRCRCPGRAVSYLARASPLHAARAASARAYCAALVAASAR